MLCKCGYDDKFEVFPADGKDQRNIDDQIKVGCTVRRGGYDFKDMYECPTGSSSHEMPKYSQTCE